MHGSRSDKGGSWAAGVPGGAASGIGVRGGGGGVRVGGVAVMEEGFPLGEPTVGFAPTVWVVSLGKYPTDELALLGLALTVAAPAPLG
jgi:hypothetical protein